VVEGLPATQSLHIFLAESEFRVSNSVLMEVLAVPTDTVERRRNAWSRAKELAEGTPETRNRYIDFLRAVAIIVVVLGHWLMAAPAIDRGEFTLSDILHITPWTQWLTWLFQVMPLFFIVGGYSNGVSWESARRGGRSYGIWITARLRRLIGPVVPLLLLWTVMAVIANFLSVDSSIIRVGSQAAFMPTWFLAVYVMIVVATPATHSLWRRFGMVSVWGFLLAAVLVDGVSFSSDFSLLRWANYGFVWLGIHQLGYVWFAGKMSGSARALAWAGGALAVLLILVVVAGYPVSMVTVPGEELSNSRPPTLAILALGIFHWGLVVSLEAPMRRWLRKIHPWAVTVLVNGTIMTLYLWHVTAMCLIIGLAGILDGIGLGFQPGSLHWWITRPLWIPTFAAVLFAFVAICGRFEQSSRAGSAKVLPTWQALAGATIVCIGLATLALGGIAAPGPIGIRIWILLLTFVGAGIVIGIPLRRPLPMQER
jgi:fucose 4-O-acetylase-like acetyltransferase